MLCDGVAGGDDCRRIAKATGAQVITSLADMDGDETFEASCLGEAEEVTTLLHSRCVSTRLLSCLDTGLKCHCPICTTASWHIKVSGNFKA